MIIHSTGPIFRTLTMTRNTNMAPTMIIHSTALGAGRPGDLRDRRQHAKPSKPKRSHNPPVQLDLAAHPLVLSFKTRRPHALPRPHARARHTLALAPTRKPPAGQFWTPTFTAAAVTWLKLEDLGWCTSEK